MRREEVAIAILHLFERQSSRAGYLLPAEVVLALSERKGWTIVDLVEGLFHGERQGWFDVSPGSVRLTQHGDSKIGSGVAL